MPGYNDTPLATDARNATQPLIRENFNSVVTAWDVNHVAITHGTDYGKHNFITLPEQGASPATLANEGALFTRQGVPSGVTELCFRRESSGVVSEMTSGSLAAIGWSRLPSGLLIKWGNGTATAGLYTYTFPVGATIPAFTTIYSIQITTAYINASDGDGVVRLNNFTAPYTQFSVYASQRTAVVAKSVNFQYLAIGV